jgi:hypothetical protein
MYDIIDKIMFYDMIQYIMNDIMYGDVAAAEESDVAEESVAVSGRIDQRQAHLLLSGDGLVWYARPPGPQLFFTCTVMLYLVLDTDKQAPSGTVILTRNCPWCICTFDAYFSPLS